MTTTECEVCFAVVSAERSWLHREWHEQLERLLAELLSEDGEP